MTVLNTASRSRAEDAAHRAVADIGATLGPGDYRLVGGQMVTLLVARYQPPDVPLRTTADADIGMRVQVVADGAFVDELIARGYVKRGGNRFVRDDDTIDVLVPAAASRARHNRRAGALVVDEISGLSFAAMTLTWPTVVRLPGAGRDGTRRAQGRGRARGLAGFLPDAAVLAGDATRPTWARHPSVTGHRAEAGALDGIDSVRGVVATRRAVSRGWFRRTPRTGCL